MKKTLLLLAAAMLWQVAGMAAVKDSEKKWYVGTLLLKNGESIEGPLQYNHKRDVVQCKENGKIKAFSAHNVKYFRFYDPAMNADRVFQSLAYEDAWGYERENFYEILLLGKLPLLGRLKFEDRKAMTHQHSIKPRLGTKMRRFALLYDYYVYEGGQLIALHDFQEEIMPLLADKEQQLNKHIKKENLRRGLTIDQVNIIKYYNSLEQTDKALLSEIVSHNQ